MTDEGKRGRVRIIEVYTGYEPPYPDVAETVRELLDALPLQYLGQLQTLVLTNYGALSRPSRRRRVWAGGRKLDVRHTLGSYMPAWQGQRLWIQLLVDHILDPRHGLWLKLRFLRTGILARTLYHEIGHHLHATLFPDRRDKETVADEWSARLWRRFRRRRYWYLPWPVIRALLVLVVGLQRLTSSLRPPTVRRWTERARR